MVRTCSVNTGSGRMDQEIVQVSHCGYLSLKNFIGSIQNTEKKSRLNMYKGCLSVCAHDDCNRAVRSKGYSNFFILFCILFYFKILI